MQFIKISSLIFLFFLGLTLNVSAQNNFIEQNISIDVTPEIPGPEESVLIEIESFITDLNRGQIVWRINGKTVKKGTGAKTLRFTNGSIGEKTNISITITTQEGLTFEKKLSFIPALVDIIWETDTYTPPFYKGKPLPTSESSLKLVALPQFSTNKKIIINPNNFIYTWSKDRRIIGKQSGFGRKTLTTKSPLLYQNSHIKVEVSSFDNSLRAKKEIFVFATEPNIIFYEKHPLLGILYNKALTGSFSFRKNEVVFRAEPYYFSQKDILEKKVVFRWLLNGQLFEPTISPQEVVLRQTEETGGVARLNVSVNNLNKLLQNAGSFLSLQF